MRYSITCCPHTVHMSLQPPTCCPHAVHMLSICHPHTTHMLSICCPHTVLVVSMCHPHAVLMVSTCCPHAVLMVSTCCPHDIHMLSTCHPHAVCMTYTCHSHAAHRLGVEASPASQKPRFKLSSNFYHCGTRSLAPSPPWKRFSSPSFLKKVSASGISRLACYNPSC